MAKNYFQSEEFREILHSYEQQKDKGKSIYLDADDFADVADYYLSKDQPAYAMEAAEMGLAIHPDDDVMLIVKSAICIYMHRYDDAEAILGELDQEDTDVKYQQAQLQYAYYNRTDVAEKMWREWLDQDDDDSSTDELRRENYIHIISSLLELVEPDEVTGMQNWDEKVVRKWIREYIDTFQPLGKYESDVQLVDICRENDLMDLMSEALSQVLEEQPYLDKGWSYLAWAYYCQHQYTQALEAADFALAIQADDLDAMLTKAHTLNSLGDKQSAKVILKEYLDKGGQITQIIPYAEILLLDGEKDEAIYQLDWLSSQLERERTEVEKEMNENQWDESDSGREERASYYDDFFDKYLRIYSEMGDLFYRYECFEDSIIAYKRMLEVDSHCSEAYFMLGIDNLALFRHRESVNNFRLALKWSDDPVMTGVDIALTYVLNDFDILALEVINLVDKIAVYNNSVFLKNIPAVKSLIYLKMENKEMFLHFFKISCQKTPNLMKKIYEGYFPDDMPVDQWYDYAETEIDALIKKIGKENLYVARF